MANARKSAIPGSVPAPTRAPTGVELDPQSGIQLDPQESAGLGQFDPRQPGETGVTWGLVDAFTVDEDRLLIKLNVSAISRRLVSVAASHPQFATAVSLTMLAYNNRDRLSVRYVEPHRPQLGPPMVGGLAFGLGEDAFEIEDYPLSPPA